MTTTLEHEMAARGVRTLRTELDTTRRLEHNELLERCDLAGIAVEGVWARLQSVLERGVEGRKLTFLLKEFSDAISPFVRAMEQTNGKSNEVLTSAKDRVRAILDKVHALISWLERPAPMLIPESSTNAAPNLDDYEDLDTLLSRLRRGEGA